MTKSETAPNGWIAWLAGHRALASLGLIGLGIALAVVPTLLVSWHGREFLGLELLTGLLALLVVCGGVMLRFFRDDALADGDLLRMFVLVLGGLGGLLVALIGLALNYTWWDQLTDWLSRGRREGAGKVLLGLAVLLAGLAIMFVTLQSARSEERSRPGLRRLIHGYNVVLTGLLLFLILAVVNVLAGLKFPGVIDATASGEYSLSERATNLLAGVDKPIRVYVIWPTDDYEALEPLRSLLGSFQDRSANVKVEYLSPGLNQQALGELLTRYPRKIEGQGVLMVVGDEKPENASFIKASELFEEGFGNQPTKFRGEDKLVAALSALEGGGQNKAIVYFTQGQGEPSLMDANPRGLEPGLGVLRERLSARGNFDIRPLKINPADPRVPDDAKVLVVANPKPPIEPPLVQALRNYLMERRGKAIVLLDVPAPPTGETMPPTGLEGLLGEFGVEVTTTRLMSIAAEQFGETVMLSGADGATVEVNPELVKSRNEVALAFAGQVVPMRGVRIVRPLPQRRPDVLCQAFLLTRAGGAAWAEPNWQADPAQLVRTMQRDPKAREKIATEPLPAAVICTSEGKPRLTVFGDSTFVTNRFASEQSATVNYSLFASVLDWMSERPTSIGIESRTLSAYLIDPTGISATRLVLLPGLLALIGIAGLGLGIWVIRRR